MFYFFKNMWAFEKPGFQPCILYFNSLHDTNL